MFKIYYYLSYFLIPAILINLLFRIIKNKEDIKRYKERIGKTDINCEFRKKIIWLHAASVGEFKSCDLIIEKYHKNFQILVTTTTKTSAEYVKIYYGTKVIHQYIPFDVPLWCSRFLNFWKPSLVLWIESDIWPNMLNVIKNRNINCFYINARISPKSFKRWRYFKKMYSNLLLSFNKIFVQSQNDLERIEQLSNLKAEYIGNLKLSNIHKNKYIQNNKKKFSLMIASSHKNEEEIIINNIKNILASKKLKICLAPRHPERISDICKVLINYKLSYEIDSQEKNFNKDVTIIDGFGNLNSYFNNSEIVILGGSFVNKGGHNPIEPALHGCALISGSNIYNWQNIYDEMLNQNACLIINNIDDLKLVINNLMKNKYILEKFKKKALDFSKKKFFDNEILFKEINLVLN